MAQSLMPVPTAAYAVPLSLAGTIILVAGALGIYHHRQLARERAAEKGLLAARNDPESRARVMVGLTSRSPSLVGSSGPCSVRRFSRAST